MRYGLKRLMLAGGVLTAVAACTDITSSGSGISVAALSAAFSSTPVGYGDLSTSFNGPAASLGEAAGLWIAGGRERSFDRSELMGGGLQDAFAGGVAFLGKGGHRGPFGGGPGCAGVFNATTGRAVCTDTARSGVIVTKSAKYTTAAGVVQQAFDTLTTNTVNIQTTAAGTITFDRAADNIAGAGRDHHWGRGRGHDGRLLGDTSTILTASTVIASTSDRTTSGLASGSTQRTVAGTSSGKETTTGTSTLGSFTATRVVGDTTTGLVIPVATGTTSYPKAGTVIRSMAASVQYAGKTAVTLTRREVLTYDGSATAKVVITENGVAKTCTRPLPRGPLTCG